MKSQKQLLVVLVFLLVTLIINNRWDHPIFYILYALYLLYIGYAFYQKNNESLIVIDKYKAQRRYKNKDVNEYFVIFVDLANLSTYSQYYDIKIGDIILSKIYNNLLKNFTKKQIYLNRTDQIIIVQQFENTHVINTSLRMDEQTNAARKLYHYIKNSDYTVYNQDDSYNVDIHIGVASQGQRLEEFGISELMQLAQFASLQAKEHNINYLVATDETRAIKSDLDTFNKEMMKGLQLDEFSPYFIPIINPKTMAIEGCESLVRWQKDTYRVIEASKFKSIANEKQLFEKIDRRIIEKTFLAYKYWKEHGLITNDFKLTINLSYRSLLSIETKELLALTKQFEIRPTNIEFDINEESAMSDEGITKILHLKSLGFKISLDVLNTKCFSLKSIFAIEFDTIKIDRVFLPHSQSSSKELSFYKTIVDISKSMNLNIMSKGIEEKHHLNFAFQLNVDYVQGYYFTPPLDNENFIIYLKKYINGILTH